MLSLWWSRITWSYRALIFAAAPSYVTIFGNHRRKAHTFIPNLQCAEVERNFSLTDPVHNAFWHQFEFLQLHLSPMTLLLSSTGDTNDYRKRLHPEDLFFVFSFELFADSQQEWLRSRAYRGSRTFICDIAIQIDIDHISVFRRQVEEGKCGSWSSHGRQIFLGIHLPHVATRVTTRYAARD